MYLEMQLYLWWSLCTLKCSCTSGGVYVPGNAAVPLVEFMYLEVQLYLWWSLCTLKCSCTSGGVYVPQYTSSSFLTLLTCLVRVTKVTQVFTVVFM